MRYSLKICLIIACASYCVLIAKADTNDSIYVPNTKLNDGFFRPFKYNASFLSDLYPEFVRMQIVNATNSAEYDYDKTGQSMRTFLFANLGINVPLWSGYFNNRQFAFAAELPFSIDVWMDMFQKSTAPLINSSFWFGTPEISFTHFLRKPWMGIKNYSLKWGPFEHECTHIGDEITLMRREDSLAITRINVSYYYSDLVFTINAIDDSPVENHGFRFGLWLMYHYNWNWYQKFSNEADESKVEQPAGNFYEYFFQYQYQTPAFGRHFQGIAASEIRNKQRYIYPYYDLNPDGTWNEQASKNERTWCFHAVAGIRYNTLKNSYFSRIGVTLNAYYGLNPHGQFRNRNKYLQYGFSLIFE